MHSSGADGAEVRVFCPTPVPSNKKPLKINGLLVLRQESQACQKSA